MVIFIYKNTALLPDFILNSNIKLKDELRGLLNNFYSNISKKLNDNIKSYLKEFSWFKSFRWETQIKWVSNSLENNDFLTILSTWGWKSLIYQLPAWLVWKKLWHLTLIITPLKALIKDQIDWLRNKNFNEVNYLSWDQNAIEKDMIHNKVKSWETKILFITPESLRNEKILELLQNRYISRIVVDEAHTLILWGQEFRPDYFFIKHFLNDIQSRNLNNKINLTLLTATATVDVEKWIKDYFKERDIKLIKAKELLKENIKWSVINITNESDKIDILLRKIEEINIEENPSIIFTQKRDTAEEIEKHLNSEWIKSRFFHAWIFRNEKKKIQDDFIRGEINLIIATKAFGMWIDKANVRYVIHYDLPSNIEDYTQEIWRAWRDWKISRNIIFYNKKEVDKRVKQLNFDWLRYFHVLNFLKNMYLSDNKEKYILTPRQIASKSWIKTDKKNWTTSVKNLLNFLEQQKIGWINILSRKYDRTGVLFNKIEKKILLDSYKLIEKDWYLDEEEKNSKRSIYIKLWNRKSLRLK